MLVLANMFGVESWLIVGLVILLLFGGKKIPELMRGVGRGVGELQKGINEGKDHLNSAMREEQPPYTPPAAETQPREPQRTEAEKPL